MNRIVKHATNAATSSLAPAIFLVYQKGGNGKPAWEFSKWRSEDGPAVFSIFRPGPFAGPTIATSIGPGEAIQSDMWSVPVRVILGDSLPPGRYEFAMQSGVYGTPKDFVPVGSLTLSIPPVLRTFMVANPKAPVKGVIHGQAIDSQFQSSRKSGL